MKKSIISKKESLHRFDKFLTSHWPEYSRAYLKSQIKLGKILVNNEIKKPSYILKENDEIEADILPPEKISLEPSSVEKLNIIYENADVIVIDKPAGLTVHPSATQKNGTLVNALLALYPPLKNVGDNPLRPGIVHRLDKDTSGLMIVAKNNSAFELLKNQFSAAAKSSGEPPQDKKVEKKYLALVVGKPKEPFGEIKTFIARATSDPTKQKISTSPKDRQAITFYKTIKEFKNFSLLEVWPKTGRRHQIRVHLAWLGCPVAGDIKYGRKNLPKPEGLKRQFLHAAQLSITLPSGQKRTFISPLPPDLTAALQTLHKAINILHSLKP